MKEGLAEGGLRLASIMGYTYVLVVYDTWHMMNFTFFKTIFHMKKERQKLYKNRGEGVKDRLNKDYIIFKYLINRINEKIVCMSILWVASVLINNYNNHIKMSEMIS